MQNEDFKEVLKLQPNTIFVSAKKKKAKTEQTL